MAPESTRHTNSQPAKAKDISRHAQQHMIDMYMHLTGQRCTFHSGDKREKNPFELTQDQLAAVL